MSIKTISDSISRNLKELADIEKKISQETKKESDLIAKISQIHKSITKSTSTSLANSKLSEIQRKHTEISSIQNKKANLLQKKYEVTKKLYKYKEDLSKEEEREGKKISAFEKNQQREQMEFQKKLRKEIEASSVMTVKLKKQVHENEIAQYDIFISHASEDKDDFVRPLAVALEALGVKVWYDEFTLKVGDSLRKKIDQGLVKSTYGTVVLSSSFFEKNWTQYEFDGMVAKEINGHKMILPIWHKVSKTDVLNFSPTLADKVALNSSLNTIEEIAQKLFEVVKGST